MDKVTPSNVKIALNVKEKMKFYHFKMSEISFINGRKQRSEIEKTYHLTIKWLPDNKYSIRLETFDRLHRNREISVSEKIFTDKLAYISNDVCISVNHLYEPTSIDNIPQIREKAIFQINRLEKKYVGINAENIFLMK